MNSIVAGSASSRSRSAANMAAPFNTTSNVTERPA